MSGSSKTKSGARGVWVVAGLVVVVLALQVPGMRSMLGLSTSGVDDPEIWTTDFSRAMTQSRQTGKPVLIRFTADWCPPCRRMKTEAWPDERVRQFLTERYTPLYADIDTPDGRRLGEQFGVSSIPTIMILSLEGQPARIGGFMTRDELITFLRQ